MHRIKLAFCRPYGQTTRNVPGNSCRAELGQRTSSPSKHALIYKMKINPLSRPKRIRRSSKGRRKWRRHSAGWVRNRLEQHIATPVRLQFLYPLVWSLLKQYCLLFLLRIARATGNLTGHADLKTNNVCFCESNRQREQCYRCRTYDRSSRQKEDHLFTSYLIFTFQDHTAMSQPGGFARQRLVHNREYSYFALLLRQGPLPFKVLNPPALLRLVAALATTTALTTPRLQFIHAFGRSMMSLAVLVRAAVMAMRNE